MGHKHSTEKPVQGSASNKLDAIEAVQNQRNRLNQSKAYSTVSLQRAREIASDCLFDGDKARALLVLRQRQHQQSILRRVERRLEVLEQLIATTDSEFAEVEKDVAESLQESDRALCHLADGLKLENVEKLRAETADAIRFQRMVLDLMKQDLTNGDETEVKAEFERLQSEVDERVKRERIHEVYESNKEVTESLKTDESKVTQGRVNTNIEGTKADEKNVGCPVQVEESKKDEKNARSPETKQALEEVSVRNPEINKRIVDDGEMRMNSNRNEAPGVDAFRKAQEKLREQSRSPDRPKTGNHNNAVPLPEKKLETLQPKTSPSTSNSSTLSLAAAPEQRIPCSTIETLRTEDASELNTPDTPSPTVSSFSKKDSSTPSMTGTPEKRAKLPPKSPTTNMAISHYINTPSPTNQSFSKSASGPITSIEGNNANTPIAPVAKRPSSMRTITPSDWEKSRSNSPDPHPDPPSVSEAEEDQSKAKAPMIGPNFLEKPNTQEIPKTPEKPKAEEKPEMKPKKEEATSLEQAGCQSEEPTLRKQGRVRNFSNPAAIKNVDETGSKTETINQSSRSSVPVSRPDPPILKTGQLPATRDRAAAQSPGIGRAF